MEKNSSVAKKDYEKPTLVAAGDFKEVTGLGNSPRDSDLLYSRCKRG